MNRFFALIFLCVLAIPVNAASSNVGTDAFLFMRMGFDSRGMALGGARVALVDGVSSLIWNPAGLARFGGHQIMFSNSQIFEDQSANLISYAGNFIGPGAMAAAFVHVNLGDFEKTQIDLATGAGIRNLGTGDGSDIMGIISYGWTPIPDLDLGGSLKIAHEKLDDESATGFAVDLGLKYEFYPEWFLAAAVQNLGPSVSFISKDDDLPLQLRAGVGTKWYQDMILTEIDLVKPSSNTVGVNLGVEVMPIKYIALRLGWDSLIDAGSGLSLGFGVYLEGFEVSYTYLDADELNNQQRITVGYRWGDDNRKIITRAGLEPAPTKIRVNETPSPVRNDNAVAQGIRYLSSKEYAKAIEILKPVEKDNENNPNYHKVIGLSYFYADNLEKAKYHLQKTSHLDPNDGSVKSILGYLK